MSSRRSGWRVAAALLAVGVGAAAGAAADQKPKKPSDNYDELYTRYLELARQDRPPAPPARADWMTSLFSDFRAARVNDLITIRVVESIVASGKADSTLTKSSEGSASLTRFFGLENKFPSWLDPSNLADPAAETSFKGSGVTTRTGELSAFVTARVAEVLPSGDLVLEGAREIDINGDRQMVVLTGVVRQADISRGNTVLSTSIGQLRIRYFGRGLIKDNLQPGWLIRILNKIF